METINARVSRIDAPPQPRGDEVPFYGTKSLYEVACTAV